MLSLKFELDVIHLSINGEYNSNVKWVDRDKIKLLMFSTETTKKQNEIN